VEFLKGSSVHSAGNGYQTLFIHPVGNGYQTLFIHPVGNGYQTLFIHPVGNGYPTLFIHPVGNGYQTLFRAEEGEGNGENEWHPISVTPVLVEVAWLFNSHFFRTKAFVKGQPSPLISDNTNQLSQP